MKKPKKYRHAGLWVVATAFLLGTAFLTSSMAQQSCDGTVPTYTQESNCPDRISCEMMEYAFYGCGGYGDVAGPQPDDVCECQTLCQCSHIKCECENGSLVTITTCWAGSCSSCGYAADKRVWNRASKSGTSQSLPAPGRDRSEYDCALWAQ